MTFAAPLQGRTVEQVFPLDPMPRLIGADSWALISTGAAQRARALNAFLADVYGDRPVGCRPRRRRHRPGRHHSGRTDPGRSGFQPAAMGLVRCGRRAHRCYGLDLLTDEYGRWVVLEDNLQVPSGVSATRWRTGARPRRC